MSKINLILVLSLVPVTWAQQTGQPVRAVRSASATTAAWTSGTADETTLAVAIGNFSTVAVSFAKSGTISGGVIEFEVSDDGTNYYPVLASRSGAQTVEASYTLTGTSMLWQVSVAGFTNFRVRLSTVITNTGTANIRIQGIAAPIQPYIVSTVNSLPTLPSGVNNIGDVDVLTIAAGDNNIGNVDVVTMPTVTANATLAAETTKVIGTARIIGNAGAAFDAATSAAVPANAVYTGVRTSAGLSGQIGCTDTYAYDGTTSGNIELVALTANQVIYVCGYTIFAGGTVNVRLVTGTGSACATGEAGLTPAFQLTAQTGAVDGSPFYRGLKSATGGALCLETSGAVAVQAIVYYTKFQP